MQWSHAIGVEVVMSLSRRFVSVYWTFVGYLPREIESVSSRGVGLCKLKYVVR
jgi:hypothetical protein